MIPSFLWLQRFSEQNYVTAKTVSYTLLYVFFFLTYFPFSLISSIIYIYSYKHLQNILWKKVDIHIDTYI